MVFNVYPGLVDSYPCDTAIYIGYTFDDKILMQFQDDNDTRMSFTEDEMKKIFMEWEL